MTISVVYNRCYGGFSVSPEAIKLGRSLSNNPKWGKAVLKGEVYDDGSVCTNDYGFIEIERHDPVLVTVVKTLGINANGECAKLAIHELSGNRYKIDEYDGMESVDEPDDIEFIVVK